MLPQAQLISQALLYSCKCFLISFLGPLRKKSIKILSNGKKKSLVTSSKDMSHVDPDDFKKDKSQNAQLFPLPHAQVLAENKGFAM